MSDDKKRIEELEYKVGQAYQVIGVLLAELDCRNPDFDSPEGQHALDYFASEEFDDGFLPFMHPRHKPCSRYRRRYCYLPRRRTGVYRPRAGSR